MDNLNLETIKKIDNITEKAVMCNHCGKQDECEENDICCGTFKKAEEVGLQVAGWKHDSTWHLQSEDDIFNQPIDWSATYYAVVMNDGSRHILMAVLDVNLFDGEKVPHYDIVDSEYLFDSFDDIKWWCKFPE